MATGFDELVEQLLYDVALSGARGIGSEELSRAVKTFYDKPKRSQSSHSENDLLFSNAPPQSSIIVDGNFLDTVWDWLEKHPDIEIVTADIDGATPSTAVSKHSNQRIFTNEDRVWQVIAGHGVDHARIPPKQFECLSVIAAHGPNGVLQPTVRKLTGQDKRSVPKRTDMLAEKGYITKEVVIGGGNSTAMLKLRKFTSKDSSVAQGTRLLQGFPEDKKPSYEDIAYYDTWFKDTMRLLQENDNVITFRDLNLGLGLHGKAREQQAKQFRRCIKRLVDAGCVRKLRARVEDESGTASDTWTRCLQLLREPTEQDRVAFMKSKGTENKDATNQDGDSSEDARDDNDVDDEGAPSSTRIPPQWTPGLPYTNFAYNIVENAGPDGISSMALNERATGTFWRRPLDEIMLRLTDVWQISQPSHLRHLSIIRDTEVEGKLAHFKYRTRANFEKAVEMGQTEWAAVQENESPASSAKKKKQPPSISRPADLDEWGFPQMLPSLFAGSDGRGSLLDCQTVARREVKSSERDIVNGSPGGLMSLSTRMKRPVPKPKVTAPKRILNPYRTPNPIEKIRSTTENDEKEYEMNAERMANMLARAESNSQSRKRTGAEAQLEQSGPRSGSKAARVDTTTSASPATPQGLSEEAGIARVEEIKADLLARSKPGVYINPPGAKDLKAMSYIQIGRPRRALIAVIKSDKLKGFKWFKREKVRFAPKASRPSTHDITIDPGHADSDVEEGGSGQSNKRKRTEEDASVLDTRSQFFITESPQTATTTATPLPAKRKRGRPSNAEREKRQFVELLTSSPAISTPAPAETPAPTISPNGTLIATPTPAPTSNAFLVRFANALNSVIQEPTPTVPSTAAGESQLSTFRFHEPASPLAAGSSNTSPFAKRRGRPPKWLVEERERIRREQEGKTSLIVKLPLSSDTLRQEAKRLEDKLAEKQTLAKGFNAHEDGTRRSLLVRLPISPTVDRDGQFALPADSDQAIEDAALSGPSDEDTANSKSLSRRQSLVAKLPLPKDSGFVHAPSRTIPDTAVETPVNDAQQSSRRFSDGRLSLIAKLPLPSTSVLAGSSQVDYTASTTFGVEEGGSSITSEIVLGEDQTGAEKSRRPSLTAKFPIPGAPGNTLAEDIRDTNDGHSHVQGKDFAAANAESVLEDAQDDSRTAVEGETVGDDSSKDADFETSTTTKPSKLLPVEIDDSPVSKGRTYSKAGTTRHGGVVQLRRSNIILEIIRQAGGAFPFDDDVVWYPFVTQWQKLYTQTPDRRTVENAVNNLVHQQKLKKFRFSFTDKKRGRGQVQRHIIAEPDIGPDSAKAKWLQKAIVDAYPYRYIPDLVEVEKRLRDSAKAISSVPNHKDAADSDSDYVSFPKAPSNSGNGLVTPYWGNFPAVQDVTVKRTPQGKATLEAQLQLHEGARSGKRKRGLAGRPRKRLQTDISWADQDAVQISDESEDEDDDGESDNDQLAMQNNFQVGRNVSDPKSSDTMVRRSRLRTSLTTGFCPKAFWSLLQTPEQVFHAPSGTFGSQPQIKKSRKRRNIRREIAAKDIDWNQLTSAPESIDDLLKRADNLGFVAASKADSAFYQFQCEIDRIQDTELVLANASQDFKTPEKLAFIVHKLNCAHTKDDTLKFGVREDGFVDGFLPVLQAEKQKSDRKKPRQRLRAPAGRKATSKTTPLQNLLSGQPSAGFATYPPAPLFNPFGRRLPTTNLHLDEVQHQLYLPRNGQTIAKALQPSPAATATYIPNVYQTRFKGQGRPQLAKIAGVFDSASLTDSDAASTSVQKATKRGHRNLFQEPKRLAIAVALVKILCGGAIDTTTNLNWDIVAHALGFRYEATKLKARWKYQLKSEYGAAFESKLQGALHVPFLKAYENGELPSIDFENLQGADWPDLVRWVQKKFWPNEQSNDVRNLSQLREALKSGGSNGTTSTTVRPRSSPASLATEDGPSAKPGSKSGNDGLQKSDVDKNYLAKSWIRAIAATKDHLYNQEQAVRKLERLGANYLDKMINEMMRANIVARVKKERQLPGRNYRITPDVLSQFDRWPNTNDGNSFVRQIATFWNEVVNQMLDHGKLELGSNATEAQLIVLTNMVSQGLLRIGPVLSEHNDNPNGSTPRLSKWGFAGYTRNVKQVNISDYQFSVTYSKSSKFTSDHGLKAGVQPPMYPPAVLGEPGFRHPFWVDIHGNLIDDVWDMIIQSVIHLLVFKPGSTATSIEKAHESKLWAWEIESVLKWMETAGIAVRCGAGKEVEGEWKGGWRASEWWYCAFLPEIATWEAPQHAGQYELPSWKR